MENGNGAGSVHPFELFRGRDAIDRLEGMQHRRWRLTRYDSVSGRALLAVEPDPFGPRFPYHSEAYLIVHGPHRFRYVNIAQAGSLQVEVNETMLEPAATVVGRLQLSSQENELLLDGGDLSLFVFAGGPEDEVPMRCTYSIKESAKRNTVDNGYQESSRFVSEASGAFETIQGCDLKMDGMESITPYHTNHRFRFTRAGNTVGEFVAANSRSIDVLRLMHQVKIRLASHDELAQYAETLPPEMREWVREELSVHYQASLLGSRNYPGRLIMECKEGVFGVWSNWLFFDWLVGTTRLPGWDHDYAGEIWRSGPRLDGDWYH